MEVRGNHQHRFELRELSKRLGGYRVVIDETVPQDEIHVITKTKIRYSGENVYVHAMYHKRIYRPVSRAA